jgi:hypothetical protein
VGKMDKKEVKYLIFYDAKSLQRKISKRIWIESDRGGW